MFPEIAVGVNWRQDENPHADNVWQLVLQLRQMVEFIRAPAISSGLIAC